MNYLTPWKINRRLWEGRFLEFVSSVANGVAGAALCVSHAANARHHRVNDQIEDYLQKTRRGE